MKGTPLRALIAVVAAGAATLLAVRARDRRRALTAGVGSAEPSAAPFAEANLGDVATGEGMPEAG